MEKVLYLIQAMLCVVNVISIVCSKAGKRDVMLALRGSSITLWIITLGIYCYSNSSIILVVLVLINTALTFVNNMLSKKKE